MNVFGNRLKSLREAKKQRDPKWTQEYIAEILGVARPTFTAYENNTKQPPMETINKIIDLLETTADYLYGRTNDPHPQWVIDLASGGTVKVPINLMDDDIDPEINVFFKDFQSAPKEKQEEMLRFWNFIKGQEKGRKSGDKQGE